MNENKLDFEKLAGYYISGDIKTAMEYMKPFSECAEIYNALADIFENENYINYDIDEELNEILKIYQIYFRDCFYIRLDREEAKEKLIKTLAEQIGVEADEEVICEKLKELFNKGGYNFLGGDTNGYYGPYIWKDSKRAVYNVELPEGNYEFGINMLDGFIMRSWMAYLSFGEKGTGGWTDKDGTINCVASDYDVDSDRFRLQLLKHEAQHSMDMKRWKDIEPSELEYRAKLVELINWKDNSLLNKFIYEADEKRSFDSHSVASLRIYKEMSDYAGLEQSEISKKALELFKTSTKELNEKYAE